MKKRKKHKTEQLLAWFAVLIIVAAVITGFVFLFIKIKSPLAENISTFWKDINTVSVAEESQETDALESGDLQGEVADSQSGQDTEQDTEQPGSDGVMDEETLEQLFSDTDLANEDPVSETLENTEADEFEEKARAIVADMTLSQKVCQLFFIAPEAITGVNPTTAAGEKTRLALEERPVGGIILFKKNLEGALQLKQMTANLQKYSEESAGVPLFIGLDEEGGRVARIAGNDLFDVENVGNMRDLAASGEVDKVKEAGSFIGSYLKEYGININFAPDADVVTDESNTAIGDRSFGSDPDKVGECALAYLDGLKEAGVAGVPKHFPGHGAVAGDTHDGPAATEKDWGELEESDLIPFQTLIDGGARFLMVSHISVPEVTGEDIPVSMSGIILTDKLRLQMGYKGIIITEAMNMEAVVQKYEAARASVEALKAGVDMILMPSDFEAAYQGVMTAVEEGTISEQRIDESCIRIVKTKLLINEED